MSEPQVSIIIPTWNRKDELRVCLDSIAKQTFTSYEILIIDDASDDGTHEMLAHDYPDVRLLGDKVRCGHYHRRNQGIASACGEWILTLDSDIIFQDEGVMARQVACMQAHPKIGQLGGEIPLHLGEKHQAFGWDVTRGWYPCHVAATGQGDDLTRCGYLGAGCFMARRELLLEAGGFDPYYEFGQADTDLGLAIGKMGYENYTGFAYAMYHNASTGGRRKDVTQRYCFGRVRLLLKRRGVVMTILHLLWDTLQIATYFAATPIRRLRKMDDDPLKADGARYIWKAYAHYALRIRETRRACKRCFVSQAELEAFKALKEKQGNRG
ncbi:MAG: glycosyltransferase [Verrucomicrobia bacterium]|jgi:GT2 family glycosyltransferase|nr:glycosyltransferase [Verrucomicrobiota bacterium]